MKPEVVEDAIIEKIKTQNWMDIELYRIHHEERWWHGGYLYRRLGLNVPYK